MGFGGLGFLFWVCGFEHEGFVAVDRDGIHYERVGGAGCCGYDILGLYV